MSIAPDLAAPDTSLARGRPGPCPVTGAELCLCAQSEEETPATAETAAGFEPVTAPARDDDIAVIPTGDLLSVAAEALLANDRGTDLQIVAVSGADLHLGQITAEDRDGDGVATFTYTVTDGSRTDTAEATLRVWQPQTPAEIDAFVLAVLEAPEQTLHHHDHAGGGDLRMQEHGRLLDLVPRSAATHIAVRNGDWSDPATWWEGRIPDDGAEVLIPGGIAVTVETVSDARLSTLRVDGTLAFSRTDDSRLMVETLVTTAGSRLEIGTEAAPIPADISAEIVILSETPGLLPGNSLARGLVTHGAVSIQGAVKDAHAALAGEAMAGADRLTLADAPAGWAVGDRIVLAGTSYDAAGSDADNSRFQDEVLRITAIDGRTLRFVNEETGGTTLRFDHRIPEGYEDRFEIPLGNLSRSVTIRSEGGKDTAIPDRGHVMLMHSDAVSVKHAAFVGLGRSDKNALVDDPGTNVDGGLGPDGTEAGTNPRGRYALHLHRLGVEETAAVVEGVAIEGSPGWGLVHHDSHAVLEGNFVFDVLGSAIVAEAGNETGRWADNLTIKTTGDDRPQPDFDGSARVPVFDFGFNGEGYWIQGAPLIEFANNTAASANGAALEIFTDVDGNRNKDVNGSRVAVATLAPEQRDAFVAAGYGLSDEIDIRAAISPGITGFQAINSQKGIETWNHMRNDDGVLSFFGGHGHALRTEISDFELWGIFGEGIFTQYSTQIDFVDGVIVGDPDDPVDFRPGINGGGLGRGIGSNGPAHDLRYENIVIDGFEVGLRLPQEAGSFGGPSVPYFDFNGTEVAGLTVSNVESVFGNTQANWADPEPFPNFIALTDLARGAGVPTGEGPAPAFTARSVGGAGVVVFDASASRDTDWNPMVRLSGNAIAAYGWDFDRDGRIDAFGRWVTHDFGAPGTYAVDLTVWDSDGQAATETRHVTVHDRAYGNLVQDGGFDAPLEGSAWYAINPAILNQGWKTSGWSLEGGAASAPLSSPINNGLQQVILDNGARQGVQDFVFDLDYSYFSDVEGRHLDVAIWGFETEFTHSAGGRSFDAEGTIPTEGTLLFHEEFGDTDGWETIRRPVDFGEGHKFLTVSFQFEGRFGDADAVRPGDAIRLDNLAISDDLGALDARPIGAAGTLTIRQPDRETWHRVEFGAEIEDAVVILGPLTDNGRDPVTLRLGEVDETGFTFQVEEWIYLDGVHMAETLSWMAVSEGTHRLADGRRLEAGRTTVGTGWERTNFDGAFEEDPVLLGQVRGAETWGPSALRFDRIGEGGFRAKIREAENANNRHPDEGLDWIAIEAGDGAGLEAGRIAGVDHTASAVSFSAEFEGETAFLAAMQSHAGADPATLRMRGLWNEAGARLFVDEETSRDAETWHKAETVGYAALETGLIFAETLV